MPRINPWEAVRVQCPFYISSGQKSILCEGHAEGAKMETQFGRGEWKDQHMTDYCCTIYEDCPVYQLAMKKYK